MQRPQPDFDSNNRISPVEQLDKSLPLPTRSSLDQTLLNLSRIAHEAGLNHTLSDVTHFFAKARCLSDLCGLMQLPLATLQPVFKSTGIHFIEIKLNVNSETIFQQILTAPHKTLEDFATHLQVHPDEIADYLNEKQLPPYWKIRFLQQSVGNLLLRLRPESKGGMPVSIVRVAYELGTDEMELNADLMRIFSFSFDDLIHLISKISPEKFYALVKDYDMELNVLTSEQLFLLKTQLSLACHSIPSLFGVVTHPDFGHLLLQNPHVVLPPSRYRH